MDIRSQDLTGMTVRGSDGDKVGKIVEVSSNYVVVEKGFFFPSDHYIPTSAISSVGDDEVFLSVTKDDALNKGWDEQPADWNTTYGQQDTGTLDSGTPYRDTSYGQADPVAATNAAEIDKAAATTGRGASEVIAPDYVAADDRRGTGAGTEAVRVPVYDEDIAATTRDVDRGAVRIEKEMVTEDRTISVPVTEERVRVTRVDSNDPNAVGADAFEEGVIEVPVRGQEVDVEKTARKAGEVIVEKEAETKTKRVGGKVRREEVHVDDQTIDSGYAEDTRR
jgi:uncharacterized protein (TIGR02271 family)